MSDQSMNNNQSSPDHSSRVHMAHVHPTRFPVLWVIPLLAIFISGWLAWQHFMTQGPVITISFETADGITPGQTQVKNKAVTLGVVRDVTLSPDMSHADVTVQMNARSANYLTDRSRFWVVRPRINGTSITGLETVLSGAYIALDPGMPGGRSQRHFRGLETPPGVRSDQPGSTFWLVTPKLNSLGAGAPIFYRDLAVGEVLGYTMPPGGEGPILLKVFVRAPYDRYLHTDSHFWNVSGLQIGVGAGGLQIRLQSFQALLSGGVAFGRGADEDDNLSNAPAQANSVFRLYNNQEEADNTRYRQRLRFATYVDSSVGGLTRGSKITMFGLQVGTVLDVYLETPDMNERPHVRIDMEIEPGRVITAGRKIDLHRSRDLLDSFVRRGLRASVQSVSFLTGEAMIVFSFIDDAKPVGIRYENGIGIIPSQAGGMDGMMQSVSLVAKKISAMPLEQIGNHINDLLAHTDERVRSPEVTKSLVALRGSLQALNVMLDHADEHIDGILQNLQGTLKNARILLEAYGGDTDFHRNLESLIVQLSGTVRSVHQLADYLDHHPSSLITGREK